MTNHIEQMMKTAGVGFISQCKHGDEFPQNCDCDYSCEECSAQIKKYPDFTPAKQLELIKLIGQQSGFQIYQNEGMDWLLSDSICADLSFNTQGYSYSSFENALCKLTINLLKKKALNKSEVKRILEDDR